MVLTVDVSVSGVASWRYVIPVVMVTMIPIENTPTGSAAIVGIETRRSTDAAIDRASDAGVRIGTRSGRNTWENMSPAIMLPTPTAA